MACCTVVIFSASSSGISISNSSSRAMTSSTVSSESAPRSSTNEASLVTCSALTPSCSATMAFTCCSTVLITRLSLLSMVSCASRWSAARARYCRGTPPLSASTAKRAGVIVFSGETPMRSPSDPKPGPVAPANVAIFQRRIADRGFARLRHVQAAVDVQRLTGDVPGLRRCEEQYRRCNILGRTQPRHGYAGRQSRPLLIVKGLGHVRVDESRGNRIDGNAAGGDFLSQRLGEAQYPGLGCRVVDLAGIARHPDDGCNVDDPAAALFHHAPQYRFR